MWWRARAHLGREQLVLVREDPGAGVEVVLLREQFVHGAQRPAQVDLLQHLYHPCRQQVEHAIALKGGGVSDLTHRRWGSGKEFHIHKPLRYLNFLA